MSNLLNIFDVLPNMKTVLAAAGLFGLAVYQASQGDYIHAIQSALAALAVFGVRVAIARQDMAMRMR